MTQQLINTNKNDSWKREKKNQNPFHARLVRVLISESTLSRQSLRGQLSRSLRGRREKGRGEGEICESGENPLPFSLPPYPPFDACYAGCYLDSHTPRR